jgi:EAL domain-containing protein (putative c-di-GMP-specific phosphodiesterase class I)
MPATFIPVAEESGLIVPIGAWVLREACRQARAWRREGKNLTVSVNLSPRQLAQGDLVDVVRRVLKETGLPAPALCVEITEGAIVENHQRASAALEALRKLGVRIAMDDFGTGYSSLSYLKSLPVDVVKIDRSFVSSVHENKEDRAIIAAVLSLTEVMGLITIAEGVETQAQLDALRALGCEFAQGFYFGRASAAEDLGFAGSFGAGPAGVGDPLVIREFMRQIGIPARRST